jgi:PAS domain S-box-containing protein
MAGHWLGEITVNDERKTKAQLTAELRDLRRREIEYRALFEDNPQPMWVYDCASLAFLAVNDAAVGHYHYSRAEFQNMTMTDLHLPEDVPYLLDIIKGLPGPYRVPGVWRQKQKDGTLIDVEITTHDIVFDGKAARLVLANDISVRQAAERSWRYQTALIDNAAEAIVATDEKLNIQVWNTAAEQIYGWPAAEVLGRPIEHIIPGEFPGTSAEAARQQLEHSGRWRGEITQRRKDGSAVQVFASAAQLRDHDGRLFGTITVNHDITARQQAEEQLRFQASVLEQLHSAVIVTDAQLTITFWNHYAETLYQWTAQEAIGRNAFALLVRNEDVERVTRIITESLPLGYWDGEVELRRKDGSAFPAHISGAFLLDARSEMLGLVGVSEDITARKQLEAQREAALAALHESEERFRRYFELGLIGMAITSPTQGILEVNDQICAILGYDRSELLQKNWAELTHPDDLAADQAQFQQVLAGDIDGYALDKRFLRKDGRIIDTTISVKCLRRADGSVDYFVALLQDITARKQAESQRAAALQALRDSEQKFRSFVEQSSEGVVLLDEEGRVIVWNQAQEQITGIAHTQASHLPFWELQYQVLPPEQRPLQGPESFKAALRDAFRTGQMPPAGRLIDIEVQTPAGEHRFIQQTAFPIKTAQGYWIGGIFRDVTARRQVEAELRYNQERLRTLSRQLLHVQETERRAIARELHDDIGQALTAVKLDLQTVQLATDTASVRARLDDSLAGVEHVLQAVRQLSLDLRPSLLDDLGLAAALRWYSDRQGQRAGFAVQVEVETLARRPSPELETICFRVAQEALTNIVRHARAHRVLVELRQTDGQLELIIHDDGDGFDVKAARAQALRGASLGLLSMEERVMLGDGHIEIESAPGRGTLIHVWLPLSEGGAE